MGVGSNRNKSSQVPILGVLQNESLYCLCFLDISGAFSVADPSFRPLSWVVRSVSACPTLIASSMLTTNEYWMKSGEPQLGCDSSLKFADGNANS